MRTHAISRLPHVVPASGAGQASSGTQPMPAGVMPATVSVGDVPALPADARRRAKRGDAVINIVP